MTREEAQDWGKYRQQASVDPIAAERGRLLAAHAMANDPEARKRVEDAFGVDYCRQMYPECYRDIGRSGLARLVDGFRRLVPW